MEEFDKALELMERDSLNTINWAYWHLGQNHTDSAAYYFDQLTGTDNYFARTEMLCILTQLEVKLQDKDKALDYYGRLANAYDTLYTESKTEELRRITALYNYNHIKEERDEAEQSVIYLLIGLTAVIVLSLLGGLYIRKAMVSYRNKKEAEIAQARLLKEEALSRHRISLSQLDENKQRITYLEKQIESLRQENKDKEIQLAELERSQLIADNQRIESHHQRQTYLLENFRQSELFNKITNSNNKEGSRLSEEEWTQLGIQIDNIYDQFTSRLQNLYKLSEVEKRVTLLVKMDISPSQMAAMLFKTVSDISHIRSRLYYKITKQRGSAQQMDEFLRQF